MIDRRTDRTKARSRRSRSQAGQAILMVSMGIAFLMGILGLVVDVGWGYYRKQVAQAAADAAAMAAVTAAGTGTVSCGTGGVVCQAATSCSSATSGTNIYAGCEYAVANGISNANMTMTSNVTSPYNGAAVNYWVTAQASESLPLKFLRVLGLGNGTVRASATAGQVGSAGTGGGCIYTLDHSSSQALYLNGANLVLTCGVYVNSSNSTSAFELNSAASYLCYGSSAGTCSSGTLPLNMVTGAGIDCSGCGCRDSSAYGSSNNPSNTITCAPPTYGSAVTDPLASVPAPSYSGCNQTSYSWSNLSPAQTINPGVYCGGIKITGGNVTLNPGTYILNGGGLEIEGSNTTVTGTGVYFYNTSNGYAAGPLLMSGQPTVSLKAPTSGTYEGILFMQDHNVCPSSTGTINGNTNIHINGTIYLHCTNSSYVAQSMLYTGESTSGFYSALVVDTLQINGQSNLVLDPTGGQNTGIGLGGGSKTSLIN